MMTSRQEGDVKHLGQGHDGSAIPFAYDIPFTPLSIVAMGPLTGEPKQSHPVIRTATVYSARRCAHGGEAFQLTGGGLANFDVGDSAMSFGELLQLQGQREGESDDSATGRFRKAK